MTKFVGHDNFKHRAVRWDIIIDENPALALYKLIVSGNLAQRKDCNPDVGIFGNLDRITAANHALIIPDQALGFMVCVFQKVSPTFYFCLDCISLYFLSWFP